MSSIKLILPKPQPKQELFLKARETNISDMAGHVEEESLLQSE